MGEARILGGRYELRRCIAVGDVADLFVATDRSLDRDVAVKVLHPQAAADPALVERFTREVRAAAAANDSNALAVYDLARDDGTYFAVMEHVPGADPLVYLHHVGPARARMARLVDAMRGSRSALVAPMDAGTSAGGAAGRLRRFPALIFVLALALLSMPLGLIMLTRVGDGATAAPAAAEVAGARAAAPKGTSASPAATATGVPAPPQLGTGATRPTVAEPTAQPSPSATPTALPLSQATSGALSPLDAVLGFYTNVAFHRFDQATALWSSTMQATNPPDEYIVARFTPTQRLFVQNATVTARDDAAGTATVSVQVQEAYGSPAVTRTWTGTWQLVRGPRGWLLDRAQLAQA